MTIEHRDLPESGLHEPKGVSLAASNRVYISDGAGSGTWSLVSADTLKGNISDASAEGLRLTTDGTGGIRAEEAPASSHGSMNLTDNTSAQSLTAASDSTLKTNVDFTAITAVMTYEALRNMTSGSNSLTITEAGLYVVDFWVNVKAASNATLIGFKFVVNGTDFVARAPKMRMTNSDTLHNISANGLHTFSAGDEIKIYMATSTATSVTVQDMSFSLVYLDAF